MSRIASIKYSFQDYPDPEKSCILIYLSGCSHNCPSCHNKDLQNPTYGEESTALELYKTLSILSDIYKTTNLVFQGGDPLYGDNLTFIKDFVKLNLTHTYSVCVYTGYSIDMVKSNFNKGDIDFYKCGLYEESSHRESNKTDTEFILSSINQDFFDTNFRKISKQGKLRFKNEKRKRFI